MILPLWVFASDKNDSYTCYILSQMTLKSKNMLSSDFFNCENCPALPESPACLSCTLYSDFNHAFNEGFVDGDISPLPNYSNECHDIDLLCSANPLSE